MRIKTCILLAAAFVAIGAYPQARRGKAKAKTAAKATDPKEEKAMELLEEMLPNTQKLFIIDSLVVDSANVAAAIPLPADYGRMEAYDTLFGMKNHPGEWVYVNGFGNKCFYTEMAKDSTYHICTRDKLNGKWSAPQRLDGLGGRFTKMGHPFMMSDGTTMYFAGESEDGLGGYDIYVTTYDAEEGRFLQAENAGLPYNSRSNDLLYVEDDTHNLAWLATTRRQPEGKACIYTIATSASRQNHDADIMEEDKLRNFAAIMSIRDTWPSAEKRKAELARLASANKRATASKATGQAAFVVDDLTTYTSADQFSTPENIRMYKNILAKQKQRADMAAALEEARAEYHAANATRRKAMGQELLKSEQALEQLDKDIARDSKTLRRNEQALTRK